MHLNLEGLVSEDRKKKEGRIFERWIKVSIADLLKAILVYAELIAMSNALDIPIQPVYRIDEAKKALVLECDSF